MSPPLHGIRVIDMSHVIAGPLASHYLAQLGAEVIKIEPVAGEVMRGSRVQGALRNGATPSGFVSLNAGKKSLAVDIRVPEGADLVRRLAATAHVFIENFRPGKVDRHGLGYGHIRAVQPRIVYCSISGYGQQGPLAARGAYDHVMQALTGMMMMSGEADDAPPIKVGFPVIDVAVGMLGALSITAALHRADPADPSRRAGGYIDASMLQASLMLMYPHACSYMTHGAEPRRVGNRGYTGSPTADTYRCRDGWLAVAANTPAQFRVLARMLGMEGICEDGALLDLEAFHACPGGFVAARNLPALRARFQHAFAGRSAAQAEEELNRAGIPAARVRRIGEFLQEGGALGAVAATAYPHAAGDVSTPGLGFQLQDLDQAPGPAPALGADSRALLQSIGLGAAAIDALQGAGVIAAADAPHAPNAP